MQLLPIVTGAFQVNCYLVWKNPEAALVIDPGDDAYLITGELEKNGLTVAAYICTHGHADHISALAELHEKRPAPIAMHSSDWTWAFDVRNRLEPYYTTPVRPDTDAYVPLEREREWIYDGLRFQCIETPGHSPGSCCLLFPDDGILMAGDTLFKGSCGRTDLPGGNPGTLKESLDKLKQLPDDIRVFPGHGPDTTIGIERRTNIYMQ